MDVVRNTEGRLLARSLGRIGSVLAALAIVLTAHLGMPRPVFACDCTAAEPMAAYAGQPAWTIFTGVVQAPDQQGVPVLVSRWFQGDGAAAVVRIQGTWGAGGASCETPLPLAGTEWIFVSSRRETGELDVNLCTPHAAVGTDAGAAMLADAIGTFGDGGGAPAGSAEPVAAANAGGGGTVAGVAAALTDPVVLAGGAATVIALLGLLLLVRRRPRAA